VYNNHLNTKGRIHQDRYSAKFILQLTVYQLKTWLEETIVMLNLVNLCLAQNPGSKHRNQLNRLIKYKADQPV
jgi:hypothetical protein